MTEWEEVDSAPELAWLEPVWVSFDGEVHLCTWDAHGIEGYRWKPLHPMTSGEFREKGSVWKPLDYPAAYEQPTE